MLLEMTGGGIRYCTNCGRNMPTVQPADDFMCTECWLPVGLKFQQQFREKFGCLPDTTSKIKEVT